MISSGESSMPPSIGLKISAVIWGKSAVVLPEAFASSIGSVFSQPEKNRQKASAQLPIVAMRRIFIDLLARARVPSPDPVLLPRQIAWQELLISFASGDGCLSPAKKYRANAPFFKPRISAMSSSKVRRFASSVLSAASRSGSAAPRSNFASSAWLLTRDIYRLVSAASRSCSAARRSKKALPRAQAALIP